MILGLGEAPNLEALPGEILLHLKQSQKLLLQAQGLSTVFPFLLRVERVHLQLLRVQAEEEGAVLLHMRQRCDQLSLVAGRKRVGAEVIGAPKPVLPGNLYMHSEEFNTDYVRFARHPQDPNL